ncbi:hypothetical protein [Vibrio alginolyticus]|uniref:hypothetical protein n=1 Tax=Vibrio alginolyticus TaxID=663 RepID=UPI003F665BDA
MIGGLLGNSGSMPISANGGPSVSGADGESSGSLSVGNINMGGGNSTTLMILVVIVIAAVLLWKKK